MAELEAESLILNSREIKDGKSRLLNKPAWSRKVEHFAEMPAYSVLKAVGRHRPPGLLSTDQFCSNV